jgi:adenylate kinase family enzyme
MASGKTTIARHVADEIGGSVLSFGDLVRSEAQRLGLTGDRATLQGLGQRLFSTLGPLGMSKMLLQDCGATPIIEGVRHVQVLEALNQLLPNLVFVYLTAPASVLDDRWATRGTPNARQDATAHSVEAQLNQLRDRAAIAIDTSQVGVSQATQIILAAADT